MTVISSATTTSYPAVGVGGLTETEWAEMNNAPDAVVEDYTGNAFGLSRLTNVARIAPGLAVVNGYRLKASANEDLACASVPTGSKTYTIAVMYDPALNVADGSGNATALGPCRLIISDAALDTTGGKKYLVLYSFVRSAGQAMTDVTIADHRHWSGPNIEWSSGQGTPAAGEVSYPRGTFRYDRKYERIQVRTLTDDTTALEWREFMPSPVIPFPTVASLVAFGDPAEMYKIGIQVYLRGSLKRASGADVSTGANVLLGTFPSGWRPAGVERFVVATTGPTGVARVNIGTDGTVSMIAGATVPQISLSGISFRAEN